LYLDIKLLKLSHVSIPWIYHIVQIDRALPYVRQESLARAKREHNWIFLFLTEERKRGLHRTRSCICFIDIWSWFILHFLLLERENEKFNCVASFSNAIAMSCAVYSVYLYYVYSLSLSIVTNFWNILYTQ